MSGILVLRHLCLLFLLCNANIFIRLVEGHNSTTPEPPTSTPALFFTPGDDVSLDRLFAINTDLLTAPAGVAGGDCTIRTSSLVPNGTFTVVLPPPIPDNNTESFETIHARTLNVSLPYLLEQIGVHHEKIPALVSEGIPLFEAAIKASLCSDPEGHNVRRGIFGDIVHFVEHAVSTVVHGVEGVVVDTTCSVFAAGALPGFLTVAALLRVENIAQIPRATTPDQDFFIFPLHGPISHNDGISVFYSAHLPPGFGDTLGITIGRNIYVRAGLGTIDSSNAGFPSATSILLHEFTHSKQYQALGYSLAAFGSQYLFNFCKAGFSYTNNQMEVDARAKAALENPFLIDSKGNPGIGMQFVKIWKKKNLQATLGLPTARTPTLLGSAFGTTVFSLPMQRGRMVIVCRGAACS